MQYNLNSILIFFFLHQKFDEEEFSISNWHIAYNECIGQVKRKLNGTKIIFLLQFLNWKFHYNWKLQVKSGRFYFKLENRKYRQPNHGVIAFSGYRRIFISIHAQLELMMRRSCMKRWKILLQEPWIEFKMRKWWTWEWKNREVKIPSIFNPLSSLKYLNPQSL